MSLNKNRKKFNVIALGNRDYYQVAFALNEIGQLGTLITDFYCPDFLRPILKKRYEENLPANKTFSIFPVSVLTFLFRRTKASLLQKYINDAFGFMAALFTFITTNHAVVYSYYLDGFVSFYKLFGLRPESLICFQVHPSPWFINKIVEEDCRAFEKINAIKFGRDIESVWREKDFDRYTLSLTYVNKIICASTVTARSLFEERSNDIAFSIVPYGSKFDGRVDKNPLKRKPHSEGKFKLLTVCQVSQRKGLHWAFQAMMKVSEPERFEWTIVSQNIDPVILEIAPKNVNFLNYLSNANLAELMSEADLFVMPSLIEGFGLVYIEALSVGTPILYTKNTGAPDFVTNRVHGFEVPVSSYIEILTIFEQIISGEIDLVKMEAGCKKIASNINWQSFRSNINNAIFPI